MVQAWTPYMMLLLFLLRCISGGSGAYVETLVGERVTLVDPERCPSGSLLQHQLTPQHAPQHVAIFRKGQWSPASGYEDRLTPGGGVEFKQAMINDEGIYILNCSPIAKVLELKVLVPYDMCCSLGGSVKLPCYFKTREEAIKSVRWKRGSELVIEHRFEPKKILYGDRFRGRVKMSQDAYNRGDLSLTLQSVHSRDQDQIILLSGPGL
ncbi:uncharacterized protein LOC129410827 [Boleophthalmus pectinirostris]|uniref:uncharacterized protein LOC129410827 n=1 Tax=Boleophthalmus pectinirostris TaxID=150288 RepID=UPI00242E6C09|nr:uncharacterized protein LOC129410827 [Boleophthalmus pectinirostris]